jgi:transcriptional/translational regulatory protein YebC/TACO1
MTHTAFLDVQRALEQAGIPSSEATIVMEPQNTVELEGKKAQQCLKLLEFLEDHDDVQSVHANLEVDERELDSGVA